MITDLIWLFWRNFDQPSHTVANMCEVVVFFRGVQLCSKSDDDGTKSSILQRFEISSAKPPKSSSAVLIVELSPLFRKTNHSGSFEMFDQQLFSEIWKMSSGFSRVDVICDQYFRNSLKNLTRIGRGDGPSNFQVNSMKHFWEITRKD